MNPILAIDVAKGQSVAAAFMDLNQPLSKPSAFKHSKEGLTALMASLSDIQEAYQVPPRIVMEATGNYSAPLAEFFYAKGFEVYVMNPLTTHQVKKSSVRKIKTDPVDVVRIAHAFYTTVQLPFRPQESIFAELRQLARQYDGFTSLTTEAELRLKSLLDSIFPGYDALFASIRNKASLGVLKAFPTPNLLMAASLDEVADAMKPSKRSSAWRKSRAKAVLGAAGESVGCGSAQRAAAISIRHAVDLLVHLEDILTDIRAQMSSIATLSPLYELLLTIPGVGEVTAAVILSEIGDINRFDTKKQLVAYAGLDPSVYQSGKFTASNNRISKRGSPYLRKALYQSSYIGIAVRKGKPVNSVLSRFYEAKREQGKPGKVALVAASNKLLCMIFGILKSGKPFEAR